MDNVTNIVQMMLRLGVKFLEAIKNTVAFSFHLEDIRVLPGFVS